jgi:hypothetical protein
MESNRKSKGKLSFEEFCESFLHGLMLGLNMLHIRSGFFYEYVERLMTYLGNATRGGVRSSGAKRGASSDEEGDDIESYEDESEGEDGEGEFDDSGEDEDTSDGDHDTEAATGRLASTIEDDTLDGMDLQSREEDSSAGGVQLEDSQVAASEVGYEGAAISVLEARQILGLTEYSSKVLCHFILQELADPRGEIDQELFFRGLSKLIGDRYVSASVLTRSKIDFVLSRLFSVFDPDDSGKCSAVELASFLRGGRDGAFARGLGSARERLRPRKPRQLRGRGASRVRCDQGAGLSRPRGGPGRGALRRGGARQSRVRRVLPPAEAGPSDPELGAAVPRTLHMHSFHVSERGHGSGA